MSTELDHLDSLAAKAYDGFLVRKDLVRKYARQYPVPTYVVEFLLGRYCASVNEAEIAEGLAIVEQRSRIGQYEPATKNFSRHGPRRRAPSASSIS